MTTYQRGDVVEASDPFTERESGRPFVIANTDPHPFADEQYVAITLTTRTWYDGTVPLADGDFVEGGVPRDSFVVPWGVVSPAHSDISDWFGRVEQEIVDETVTELAGYLTR